MKRWRPILIWGGTVAMVASILVLRVSEASSSFAQQGEIETLKEMLDDPTILANAIDSRVSGELTLCMSERGFEYIQNPNPVAAEVAPHFGIATGEPRQELSDPNLEIVRSLTSDQLISYETALYGAPLTTLDGEVVPDSCADRAHRIVKQEIEPALLELDARLDEISAALGSDDRYQAALIDWSRCMRRAQFELASPEEAETLALARFEEAGNDPAALAAAVELERQLAEADTRCRADTIDPAVINVLLERGSDAAIVLTELLKQLEQR